MKYILIIILMIIPAGCSKTECPFSPDPEVIIAMYETTKKLHTIEDVRALMQSFVVGDNISSSYPKIEQVFDNELRGGHRAASVLAQWACDEIGYENMIVELWAGKIGHSAFHSVCIVWDRGDEWHFFSNNDYARIYSSEWREPVLSYFDGKYKNIVVTNIITERARLCREEYLLRL